MCLTNAWNGRQERDLCMSPFHMSSYLPATHQIRLRSVLPLPLPAGFAPAIMKVLGSFLGLVVIDSRKGSSEGPDFQFFENYFLVPVNRAHIDKEEYQSRYRSV